MRYASQVAIAGERRCCLGCGRWFVIRTTQQVYCSSKCRAGEAQARKETPFGEIFAQERARRRAQDALEGVMHNRKQTRKNPPAPPESSRALPRSTAWVVARMCDVIERCVQGPALDSTMIDQLRQGVHAAKRVAVHESNALQRERLRGESATIEDLLVPGSIIVAEPVIPKPILGATEPAEVATQVAPADVATVPPVAATDDVPLPSSDTNPDPPRRGRPPKQGNAVDKTLARFAPNTGIITTALYCASCKRTFHLATATLRTQGFTCPCGSLKVPVIVPPAT